MLHYRPLMPSPNFRLASRMGEDRGPSVRSLLCRVSFLTGPATSRPRNGDFLYADSNLTKRHLLYVVCPPHPDPRQSYKQEDSVWEPCSGGAAQENPGAAAAAAAAASRRWAVYSRFVSCPDAAPFLSFFMSLCVTFLQCVSCPTRFGPGCRSHFSNPNFFTIGKQKHSEKRRILVFQRVKLHLGIQLAQSLVFRS